MSRPLLIIPTGVAGSGKSYFAERLSKKLPAIWIGSDGVRISMFGKDAHELSTMSDKHNKLVFSALHYFTRRALAYGANVIYDAANAKMWVRDDLLKLAGECDAIPIIVLVETPVELAFKRATTRPSSDYSWTMTPDRHTRNVEQFEPVGDTDNLITIDGLMSFEEQFESFSNQLKGVTAP